MDTYVRIEVGGEAYALSVERVHEVAELGRLNRVPGADRTVLGVHNLRGTILPVYDLAAVIGIARSEQPRRLVVVDLDGNLVGLAVDEVIDVTEMAAPSEATESALLFGAAIVGDELVGFVDVPALFDKLAGRAED